MKEIYNNTITYNLISFQYTNKPNFEEREIHNYLEILYYLGDDTTIVTENHQQKLKQGSLLLIPPKKYHLLKTTPDEDITRLKISLAENYIDNMPTQKITEIKIFENVNEHILFVLTRLCDILRQDNHKKNSFHAYASLLLLLAEISNTNDSSIAESVSSHTELVSKLIRHISDNLSEDLSIRKLSQVIHASPSTITHNFKKEIGISLHEYIKEKRLTYAKDLIDKNHNPSKIFTECGYHDYSSFYKAYINFFGHSPSKNI